MFDDLFGEVFDFNCNGHTDFAEEAVGFAIMKYMMIDEDGSNGFDSDLDSEDEW